MHDVPTSKAQLVAHINRDWEALNDFLNGLTEHEWLNVPNADGWTIKDHLTHITAWEEAVLAFIEGKERKIVLGITQEVDDSNDYDRINAEILRNRKHLTITEARDTATHVHNRLLAIIMPIDEAEFIKPFNASNSDASNPDEPPISRLEIMDVNTAEHYRIHLIWMQAQLESGA